MKTSRLFSFLLLTALLLVIATDGIVAQTASYRYIVKFRMEDKTEKEAPGFYGHYYEYADAKRNYDKLVKAVANYEKVNDYRNEMALSGTATGEFTFSGANGMGMLYSTADEELLIIMHDDGNWGNFKKGRTSKGNEYEYRCRKVADGQYEYIVFIGGGLQLENVDVKKKRQRKGGNTRSALDLNDGMEHWTLHMELPLSKHENDSRIIVLPYSIDCMTDDTIDYLPPGLYEGKDYHELQVKRKGFDYYKNDPLGMERIIEKHYVRYDTIRRPEKQVIKARRDPKTNRLVFKGDSPVYDTLMVNNDSIIKHEWKETKGSIGFIKYIEDLEHSIDRKIVIDTTIHYKKPNPNGKYRGMVKVFMEDYHHIFYQTQDPGTCLRISPYKFLQMGTATVPLELTSEFFEPSDERPSDAALDLRMKFGYNTADIIEDSLYFESMQKLNEAVSSVRDLGGQILNAELESYASPDGNDKHNMDLAERRARAAKARISLGGKTPIKTKPNIDTWEHTAELLDDAFHPAEAEVIRAALARHNGNKQAAFPEIRKYPTYQEVIKPVLESQCRIVFKFQYFTKKKLSPKEAVAAYYKNKRDLTFSNGDYYNMFLAMKDTAELDTLTTIVYDKLVKRGKQYDRPLATYAMNRMALMRVRQGRPDSTILEPLINEDNDPMILNFVKTDYSGIRLPYKQNRPEVLLNQAVIFYLLQKEERAKFFVDMLTENNYSSPALTKLKNFINFKILYTIPEENRSPQQQADFEVALKYVEESGPDNRAVLYTEFTDLQKTDMAMPYVLKMRDDNPVKWYLMGLLWAKKDGKEGDSPLPDIEELKGDTVGIDMNLNVMGYPYYMAYFHKCFEINKSFMKYYFNEGNITEEMRKKSRHAYKTDRIPIYNKILRLRAIEDKKILDKFNEMNSSDKKGSEKTKKSDEMKESKETK